MKTTLEDKPFGFGLLLLLVSRYIVIVFGTIYLVLIPEERGAVLGLMLTLTALFWLPFHWVEYYGRENYVVTIVYHRILATMLKTVVLTYTAIVEFIFRRYYLKLQALVNNLDTLSNKMEKNIIKFKEENKKLQ